MTKHAGRWTTWTALFDEIDESVRFALRKRVHARARADVRGLGPELASDPTNTALDTQLWGATWQEVAP